VLERELHARRAALPPQVPRLVAPFCSPGLADGYEGLIAPLLAMGESRGRVMRVRRETADAVSVVIKPEAHWPSHRAGQYVRLGVELDGVCHWRAYSLTSAPDRADGCISITPRRVEGGRISPYLCDTLAPGAHVRLGGVEGTFVLGKRPAKRTLLISAGSGITPIMSMLRTLAATSRLRDVVHVHCERSPRQVIFAAELRLLNARNCGYRFHGRFTGSAGRLQAGDLDELCADWRQRETFMSVPAGLHAAVSAQYASEGVRERLHTESFQPDGRAGAQRMGRGGTIHLCRSDVHAYSDGSDSILIAAERAGAAMPHGCRMGVCFSCIGRLRSGRVRDIRTGRIHGHPGELLRTCINAPEGAVEVAL
jgi:ferredoxin-NADP reductase